jgi:hypothetical protein
VEATTPDVVKLRRVEEAEPQPPTDRPATPAAALARRAAALALALEPFTIEWRGRRRVAMGRGSQARGLDRPSGGRARAPLESARNHLASILRIHRSAHSTNAGGSSLRTIMTRKMRSSRNSVAMPTLAAATVGYRAQAAARPVDDPRLIVVISLNMVSRLEDSLSQTAERRCPGLHTGTARPSRGENGCRARAATARRAG